MRYNTSLSVPILPNQVAGSGLESKPYTVYCLNSYPLCVQIARQPIPSFRISRNIVEVRERVSVPSLRGDF